MTIPPLASRVLLGCCGTIHPLRHWPPASSRQIHTLCDLEPIGIDCQMMTAKPARHEVTFRVALLTPTEPPLKNLPAVLQFFKQDICCFPIDVALDSLREPEGLVYKRERVILFQML